MKISNQTGPNLSNVDATKNKSSDTLAEALGKSSADSIQVGDPAKVNLSEKAQMMQKAKEIAMGADDVDEVRVAQLQKMIDEGRYSVDASAIADRLVDDHLIYPSE